MSSTETALARIDNDAAFANLMPVMTTEQAMSRYQRLVEFVKQGMKQDHDFGVIPGTDKPTLLKPGAEKLTTLFGLTKTFTIIEKMEDWTGAATGGEPFFYYLYRCHLSRGDYLIAEADGSCNTRESKYRWRWVKALDVPPGLNLAQLMQRGGTISEFTFAIEKAETGGQYGKPAEHWRAFNDAIENGTARKTKRMTKKGAEMDAWEIDSTMYRIPNDDIASQVNTVQKMASKRALIAATLLAVNASEFFTQDVEDIIDVVGTPVAPANGKPSEAQLKEAYLDKLEKICGRLVELGGTLPKSDKPIGEMSLSELEAVGKSVSASVAKLEKAEKAQGEPDMDAERAAKQASVEKQLENVKPSLRAGILRKFNLESVKGASLDMLVALESELS